MIFFDEGEFLLIKVDSTMSLENYLLNKGLSLKFIRKYYKLSRILVNNKFRRKDLCVYPGDLIKIIYMEENYDVIGENIDLEILYEDKSIIIINKKPGMPSHTSRRYQRGTLVNGLKYYLNNQGINRKVRLINRLDKDTSGIIIAGKNPIISHLMSNLFKENKIERLYLVKVLGRMKKDKGIINLPILKLDGEVKRIVDKRGKGSLTEYQVIKREENQTSLQVKLHTGRGHQIRVHLSKIGHPILGDNLYSDLFDEDDRLELKSNYIRFIHPFTKEVIEVGENKFK